MLLMQDDHLIQTHSRRILPMSRSTEGFCHGLCGAVRTSLMPMCRTRCRKVAP